MSKVVDISDRPPLTNIPECLRTLAKQIERGDFQAEIAVVVIGLRPASAKVFGFGDIGRSEEAIGWLMRGVNSGI